MIVTTFAPSDKWVFLDCWDTLVDDAAFQVLYREALAKNLTERFGGDVEEWARASEAALEARRRAYERRWWRGLRPRPDRKIGYQEWLRQQVMDYWGLLFREMNVLAPSAEEIVELDRELSYELTRQHARQALRPGAQEAGAALLAMGYRVGLISGGSQLQAEGLQVGMGLDSGSVAIFSAEELDCPKEFAEFYRRVLIAADAKPEHSVAVEDSSRALLWAREAGLRTIHFAPGGARNPVVDAVVSDLFHVPEAAEEMFSK